MKKTIIVSLASILLNAQEPAQINDFESLLEDVSEIATKRSLNVDYLPSVVTVIDAQSFRDIGVQTIAEALQMLPGFQIQLSPMGYPITVIRGFKNPNAYLSDKMKVLVDGVAINNEVTGSSYFYMDFPMQLVEKIEVLRGPASTMYGDGAFYGAINIITKLGKSKKENQVFLGGGSYKYLITGANLATTAGGWELLSDGYYQKNNKGLYFKTGTSSKVLDHTDERLQDLSLGFKAKKEGFEFLTRFKHNISGNFYSFESHLNPIPQRKEEYTNSYFFSQLSYDTSFNNFEFKTKLNYSHREERVDANIYSVITEQQFFSTVGITMNDGFYSISDIHEDNYGFESTLSLPKTASNDILIGIGANHDVVTQDNYYSSVENAIMKNLSTILSSPNYSNFRYRESKESAYWHNPTTSLVKNGVSRSNIYAFAQDLISLKKDVDLILGIRVDNYSDYKAQLSKRAGIVYRASDKAIFKLLYGSAFRVPTFVEAYGNGHINLRAGDPNIRPEQSNTYEAVAIYSPNMYNKLSLNFYYSQLTNVIDLEEHPNTDPGYQNFQSRYSRGLEFEYFFKTTNTHNLYFNASYIDAEYTIPPEDGEIPKNQSMPDISKVMLKGSYIYKPNSRLSFGTAWKYFSSTTPTELQWVKNDSAEYSSTEKQVHIFDETITYRFSAMSELRASVKNIFDADVRYPAYYYYTSDGGIKREGRNYLVSFTQKF